MKQALNLLRQGIMLWKVWFNVFVNYILTFPPLKLFTYFKE